MVEAVALVAVEEAAEGVEEVEEEEEVGKVENVGNEENTMGTSAVLEKPENPKKRELESSTKVRLASSSLMEQLKTVVAIPVARREKRPLLLNPRSNLKEEQKPLLMEQLRIHPRKKQERLSKWNLKNLLRGLMMSSWLPSRKLMQILQFNAVKFRMMNLSSKLSRYTRRAQRKTHTSPRLLPPPRRKKKRLPRPRKTRRSIFLWTNLLLLQAILLRLVVVTAEVVVVAVVVEEIFTLMNPSSLDLGQKKRNDPPSIVFASYLGNARWLARAHRTFIDTRKLRAS